MTTNPEKAPLWAEATLAGERHATNLSLAPYTMDWSNARYSYSEGYLAAAEPREATIKERDAEIAKLRARILELESRSSAYPGASAPISVP